MAEPLAIDDSIDAVPGRSPGAARLAMRAAAVLLALSALALLLLIALDIALSPVNLWRIALATIGVLGLAGAAFGLHLTRRRLGRMRELMQSICDEGRDAIFVKDLDSRYRFANITTASLFGRKRSEEHTSELQSHVNLVCRLLLEKKKT